MVYMQLQANLLNIAQNFIQIRAQIERFKDA